MISDLQTFSEEETSRRPSSSKHASPLDLDPSSMKPPLAFRSGAAAAAAVAAWRM
jgi:hypothetical protein